MKIIYSMLRLSLVVLLFSANLFSQSYLRVSGKNIVDESGNSVFLKGIGLGGWLLQEGYMLKTSDFASAQWQIKKKISDLIGAANTEMVYQTYRANYVRKIDVDSIAAWGFNSIRLPFHYNLFVDEMNNPINAGFNYIDSLLNWCKANQIYLILDMHAAPGGQSDEPISDYNPAKASLWQSESNKTLTVKIWRRIAERYKDEKWIGGYDLLNEPKWNLGTGNVPLRNLYIRLTDTIRAVDQNHILFIEGNWFATDFSGLTPAWDDNMVYSFHKYWNATNQSSIQYLLDLREQANRPLWLGETGENSNAWFTSCVELMKANNIGWAWWPHKKIESIAGPLSAVKLSAYQTLLNYWKGQGSQPTVDYALNALLSQFEKLKLEECVFQKDVIDALFRQENNTQTIPFAENEIPGIIHAVNFDLGKQGYAYNDNNYQNTGGSDWNNGWSYRNDGVDIEVNTDPFSAGYNVGWIEHGEWLKYTVNVTQSAIYDIVIMAASPNTGGKILLRVDGQTAGTVDVPSTGGWQTWQTATLGGILLSKGKHTVQFQYLNGGFNVASYEFVTVTAVDEEFVSPDEFKVFQNYPNPFNPYTNISFYLPFREKVTITIFNTAGEEICKLSEREFDEGIQTVQLNAEKFNMSTGVYFCKIKAGSKTSAVKKIVYIK